MVPDPGKYPLNVPVSPGRTVTVAVPLPMTEDEWQNMLAVLDAMKPGIVYEPPARGPVGANQNGDGE